MPIRKSRITKVLMWAMIPLIVFGSLPRMGCICADGQHKAFCQRHLQGAKVGGCVCCERHTAVADACGSEKPSVPSGRHSCCQGPVGKCSSGCPELGNGRPCRPVVDQLVLLSAAKSSIDLDRVDQAPLFVAVAPVPALLPCVAIEAGCGELLPPPDLVITLGVLLI